jgi:4-hydroxy-3-methylbut-2-enyl diphosphate reductase
MEGIERPSEVTVHGELVHNAEVQGRIASRGFRTLGESERTGAVPATPFGLITAHGVSDAERRRLRAAGRKLIDTTCPLVLRAHHAAQTLRDAGYHVIVVGKRGHVEVRGIVEDLDSFDVVEGPEEVRPYPHPRIGVLCQTTTTEATARAVFEAVQARNPGVEVRFVDTVCRPTKERQWALERLLGQVEAMVVVGGANSNNTRALAARCRARGLPSWHVQGPDELEASWFDGIEVVGLTAGTSTLDATIDGVERALLAMSPTPEAGSPERVAAEVGG